MKVSVYIVKEDVKYNKHTSHVKIGISHDLKKRLAALQSANAREVKLVRSFGPFSRRQALSIESQLHERMANFHVRGEWFNSKCLKQLNAICDAGFGNGKVKSGAFVRQHKSVVKRFEEEREFQRTLAYKARMMQ